MAEYSYNGWLASRTPADFGGLSALVVAGEPFAPGVRSGDVHTVLEYVAEQLHRRVEPVVASAWHQADDWGYNYRPNRNNPRSLSCHASGTAIDYNATRHPNGKRGTFTAGQVAEIRRILAEVGGVVRWGGDFKDTKDEMHFEIVGSVSAVARVAASLRAVSTPILTELAPASDAVRAPDHLPTVRRGDTGDWVALAQKVMSIAIDGDFGPATEQAVRDHQTGAGIDVDGIVGQQTWAYSFLGKHGTLRRGDSGPAVELLQNLLGFRPGSGLDGDFGPATEARVREVQRWGGVDADGVVGHATRLVLARG